MTSEFAGEAFLAVPIPDTEIERYWLSIGLALIAVALVFIAPMILGFKQKEGEEATLKWLPLINLLGFVTAIVVILYSSNNSFSARSIFTAPLLTQDECDYIIQLGHAAANRNLEANPNRTELLREPQGWRKERHGSVPTTDLNLVTDPFTPQDRDYLTERWNSRLAPLIQRIYGINPASIRANDVFLVRYDASLGQAALKPHTDESHVSFNILLNDGFVGGGTRFHNRLKPENFLDVHPLKGHVLLSNAVLQHEGLPTTGQTRFILVGFLSVDRQRFTIGKSTGLSWFASWLSLPWAQVRLKQAYQAIAFQRQESQETSTTPGEVSSRSLVNTKWTEDSSLMYHWYAGMASFLEWIGDLAPHKVYTLIPVDQTEAYLEALDAKAPPAVRDRALWFEGQRIIPGSSAKSIKEQILKDQPGTQKEKPAPKKETGEEL